MTGGDAVPASHGKPPARVRPRAALVPTTSKAAVEARSERRDSAIEGKLFVILGPLRWRRTI
jgi:hypothetical protein